MKAKRIVSILLTGSMLLSLLPVSALAAAPVFDAPAQTTAKKADPLYRRPTPPAAPRRKPPPAAAVIWTRRTAPPIVLPSS